jgi:hypothetical protein
MFSKRLQLLMGDAERWQTLRINAQSLTAQFTEQCLNRRCVIRH